VLLLLLLLLGFYYAMHYNLAPLNLLLAPPDQI
jgi:hypothetical protein